MRLQPLLSDVLKSLQEFDRENTLKALRLVKLLASHMVGPSCGPFAVEVVDQVFLFFDDVSLNVRVSRAVGMSWQVQGGEQD